MDSLESFDSQSLAITKVNFCDIQDQYSYNEDLTCRYTVGSYKSVEGDRVAIYRSGWSYVKDYFLFEWSPINSEENYVTFNKLCLPQGDKEFYQFCYVSADNEVLGASAPFQFTDVPYNYTTMSVSNKSSASSAHSHDRDREISRLREENEVLKETLKLVTSRKVSKNYDRDINELKTMIYSLKSTVFNLRDVVHKQNDEINEMKRHCVKVSLDLGDNTCDEREMSSSGESSAGRMVGSFPDFNNVELESLPPFPFAK